MYPSHTIKLICLDCKEQNIKRLFTKFRGVVFFVTVITIFGVVVMAIWNRLMTEIFGLPTLDYQHKEPACFCQNLFRRHWRVVPKRVPQKPPP